MEKRYLTIKEASQYIGFSVNTLYGWVNQRRIPFLKIGGRLRFDKKALDIWMSRSKIDPVEDWKLSGIQLFNPGAEKG